MLGIFKEDPELRMHESQIMHRVNAFRGWKEQFRKTEGGIESFAEGYKIFGFQRHEAEKKWSFNEWLPAARKVFLVGEFNAWEKTHPMTRCEYGRWSIDLPDHFDGRWLVPHRSQIRLRIESESGTFDRVPAWTKFAEDTELHVYNAVMWEPPPCERYVMRHARPRRPRALKIYEAHVGTAGGDAAPHTYLEFKAVLPKIKSLGYNTVQFVAVAEHSDYASAGRQVTSFFAPSSRFGTPEEFKELVDTAHAHGLTVLLNLVHCQLSPHELDGIASMDGTDCYRHAGSKGWQESWAAALFDYGKYEVLRFLLSNLRWWIEEYGIDGFCFAGITSMLYHSHGIGKSFANSKEHFGWDADLESATYLMLANHLVHRLLPSSGITLAEDFSSHPVLCRSVEDGGFGFSGRLVPSSAQLFRQLLQEPEEAWNVTDLVRTLWKPRRFQEPRVAYTESHQEALSGQPLGRLLAEGDQSRGLALQKVMRLATLGLGSEGYLSFMGNEFGCLEPLSLSEVSAKKGRLQSGSSSPSCAEFLEAFDEAMLALEARFQFATASDSLVSRKDDSDKVLILERGDCLFAFNFHPTRSYSEYRVGHPWKESLRVVLNSDEDRFGGQGRLCNETLHPAADGCDSRCCSARLCLPSRSVQVLVRESLLEGGVLVRLGTGPTSAWPFPAAELRLRMAESPTTEVTRFASDSSASLSARLPTWPSAFQVYWEVQKGRVARGAPAKVQLPFALETYRVHFPGTYVLDCFGNLTCAGNDVTPDEAASCGDGVPVGSGKAKAPLAQSRPHYVRANSTANGNASKVAKEDSSLSAASAVSAASVASASDAASTSPASAASAAVQNLPSTVIEVGHGREAPESEKAKAKAGSAKPGEAKSKRRTKKAQQVEAGAAGFEVKRSTSQRRLKKAGEEPEASLCKEDLEWLQPAKKVPLQDGSMGQPEPEPSAPSVVSTASKAQESSGRGSRKSSKKEAADFLGLCPKEITLQRTEKVEEKPDKAEAVSAAPRSSHRRPKKAAYPKLEAPPAPLKPPPGPEGALPVKPAPRASASRPERSTSRSSRDARSSSTNRSNSSSKASELELEQPLQAAQGTEPPADKVKRSTRSSSRRKKEVPEVPEMEASGTAEGEMRKRSVSTRRRRREKALSREASAVSAASMASDTRTEVEEPSREASVASVSTEVGRGKPPACKEAREASSDPPRTEVAAPKPKARTVLVSKFQAKHAKLAREDKKEATAVAPTATAAADGRKESPRPSLPAQVAEKESPKREILQGRAPLLFKKGSQSLLQEPEDSGKEEAQGKRQERSAPLAPKIELSSAAEERRALFAEEPLPVHTFAISQDVKKEALSLGPCGPSPHTEGYESSGTQTPKTKAVSESSSESGGGSEQMERVFSLSALDALLQDPLEKADLRSHLQSEQLDKRPKYTSQHLDTPVVVVSSEVNPWSKTGGLAMVAGSYGYEFAMRGHRTMVVSPRYGDYKDAVYVGYAKIWLDGREHEVRYFHLYQDLGEGKGTDYIFVEHESYHRGGLYCDRDGKEYVDNLFRYALLTVAAMEAPLVLNLRGSTYGQDVLFIANDWQTGLLPVYHLYKYRRNRTYLNSRCVFVIHNIGYQGKYRLSKFPLDSYLGLPPEAIDLLQGEDLNLGVDCMNLMSAAILASDRVLTVSPNYAVEVQSPEGGQGLHEILTEKGRQLRMAGILNGIADEWDPRTDPHIPRNYGLSDFLEGKAHCKSDLQRSLGLHEDPGAALLGFCGRLCFQKGVHLLTQVIPWLLTYENSGVLGRVQVILMGKGDDLYASQLSNAENTNRGRVCGYVGFDPKVEHRMMAGCDFLLMPSQYEPCGLPQMYAQAYGTVPVVHETGGLKDSVLGLWDEERDRSTATGFLFSGFEENNFKERLYQALEVYHKKQDLFRQIQQNGLQKNYYWPQAIDEYERHLDWTLEGPLAFG